MNAVPQEELLLLSALVGERNRQQKMSSIYSVRLLDLERIRAGAFKLVDETNMFTRRGRIDRFDKIRNVYLEAQEAMTSNEAFFEYVNKVEKLFIDAVYSSQHRKEVKELIYFLTCVFEPELNIRRLSIGANDRYVTIANTLFEHLRERYDFRDRLMPDTICPPLSTSILATLSFSRVTSQEF